ncbi:MAG: DUF192 domain-containing protein [Bacilli bacterium]|nr:DUF192 domain-containing protein [Bacilli bacterium]
MKIIISNKSIPLKVANSFWLKFKGFMFKKNINHALLFKNCNGIHTFFMKEEIDVILTDKENNVLYLYPNLGKNKVILPKKNVYNTYELPKGSINKLKTNDKIKIRD